MKIRVFSRLIGCVLAGVLCVPFTGEGVATAAQDEGSAAVSHALADAFRVGHGRLVAEPVWERYSRRPRIVAQTPAAPPLPTQVKAKRRVKAAAPAKKKVTAAVPAKPAAATSASKSATVKPEGGLVVSQPVQAVATPRTVASPGVTAPLPKAEITPPKMDATPPEDSISASWIMPRGEEKSASAQSPALRH